MVFNMCKQFNICSSMSSKNLYTTFLQKSGPLSVFVIWLLEKVKYLHEATGSENICMDGGVALNCVANRHILNKGPFNSGRM
ncbi:MAG: carbamoyltransferase N-terminal domain-containing protein [Sedimentibacter sp.]